MDFTHIYNTFGVFFVGTLALLFDIKTKDSLKVIKININIFLKSLWHWLNFPKLDHHPDVLRIQQRK